LYDRIWQALAIGVKIIVNNVKILLLYLCAVIGVIVVHVL
jgi:hypothetical protein